MLTRSRRVCWSTRANCSGTTPSSCRAGPESCSSTPGYTAPKWSAWRTIFESWASPFWQASRRILIWITCSGTLARPRARYGTPGARIPCEICCRTRIGRPASPRAAAEIVDEIPLDLFGLLTGLPAETAQIPWDGPESGSSSIRACPGPCGAVDRGARRSRCRRHALRDPDAVPRPGRGESDRDYLVGLRLLEAWRTTSKSSSPVTVSLLS